MSLQDLATWPTHDANGLRLPGDGRPEYLRKLLRALLRRHHSLRVESRVVIRFDGVPYFTSKVRVTCSNGERFIAYGGGSTPGEARLNGELFALRAAALEGKSIPVLGRLLSVGPVTVDLGAADAFCEKLQLEIKVNLGDAASQWDVVPVGTYQLDVVYAPDRKRTPYLQALGLYDHADLVRLVSPFLRAVTPGDKVFLHRFIAALSQRVINVDKDLALLLGVCRDDPSIPVNALADLGTVLDLKRPLQGLDLHVHHINGSGEDNRLENLSPVGVLAHVTLHRVWVGDYNSHHCHDFHRSEAGAERLWMPPPRRIVAVDHYDDVLLKRELEPYGRLAGDGGLGYPDKQPISGAIAPWTEPNPPALRAQTPAPELAPLDPDKLLQLARRRDRYVTWMALVGGLLELDMQGTVSDLKLASSSGNLPGRAIRDNLAAMTESGLLVATRLGADGAGGRGVEVHYRLVWHLSGELAAAVLGPTRRRRQRFGRLIGERDQICPKGVATRSGTRSPTLRQASGKPESDCRKVVSALARVDFNGSNVR